jgi:hypothetical protein
MRVGNLTRDFFKPRHPGALKWSPTDSKAEIWTYDWETKSGNTVYGLTGFGGKRTKPDVNYNYRTREQRDREAKAYAERQAANEAYAATKRSEAKNPHTLAVGALLYTSWGYDQTNVDFYEVVALNGKTMVTVEAIGGKLARNEESWGATYVSPDPGRRTGETSRHRVSADNTIRISSYSSASETTLDAEHYETHGMWGH